MKRITVLLAVILLFFSGCGEQKSAQLPVTIPDYNLEQSPINNLPLKDNDDCYLSYTEDNVAVLYVSVYKGKNKSGSRFFTFADLNAETSYLLGEAEASVEAIVREGTENSGPAANMFGANTSEFNAKMYLRGHSSRLADQKSYKIVLIDEAGPWRGYTTINLNKHPFDFARITNAFCYSLFKDIPDYLSAKLQFVRLYINDRSEDINNTAYQDYGLFTHIENPDKGYLATHSLDINGALYKANLFDFYYDKGKIMLESDHDYDQTQQELIIDAKANSDNYKLIKMLEDINDYEQDINIVLDRHFNRDNYFTWLSLNILLGNLDTVNQNYLLYSPKNSLTWYFLPWDFDGAMQPETEDYQNKLVPESRRGAHLYWSSILHRRVLSDPENIKQLDKKIEQIGALLTQEAVKKRTDLFIPIVEKYILSNQELERIRNNKYDEIIPHISSFYGIINKNIQRYFEAKKYPTPFFVSPITVMPDKRCRISWDRSHDLDFNTVTYDLVIARDSSMTDKVLELNDLNALQADFEMLPNGTYYVKVTATNSNGFSQPSLSVYSDIDSKKYFGIYQQIFNEQDITG